MTDRSNVTGGQKRPSTSSRSASIYPRKRAVTACSHCRQRKKKCDNVRPTCGYCAETQVNCRYDDRTEHSSFDPASLQIIGLLRQTLQEVGELRARLDGVTPVARQSTMDNAISSTNSSSSVPADISEPPVMSLVTSQMLWHSPSSMILEADAGVATPSDWKADYLRVSSSRTTSDATLRWPIFDGKYPPGLIPCAVEESSTSELGTDGGVDDLGYAAPMQLVDDFLAYVHIKNPVLDAQTLRAYARRVSEVGFEWNGPSCLVVGVLAFLGSNIVDVCRLLRAHWVAFLVLTTASTSNLMKQMIRSREVPCKIRSSKKPNHSMS